MGRKPVEINPKSGKRVKDWLDEAGIKQKELATRINWTQQNISKVIKGRTRLTPERAKDIADKVPNKDGDHVFADYLLGNIDVKTEKELIHNQFSSLYKRADLVSDLIESLGYNLSHKEILSKNEDGEFYIPMIEIKNSKGMCRYMREDEYGAFTQKIVDVVAGLLLVEMDFIKRGVENG